MTDKQIIIDGVPVQDCCYFDYENDGYEDSCYVYQNECSAQNCYYKQLKRKERRCDMWQDIAVDNGELVLKYQQQLNQLKAENEELKEELEELKEENEYNEANAIEFKQTLTEIKEIAEHCIKQDICTICDNSEKCHIEDEEIPTYDVCKLILQKISECEVE